LLGVSGGGGKALGQGAKNLARRARGRRATRRVAPAGHGSVWVNGNGRMSFSFEGENTVLVDIRF